MRAILEQNTDIIDYLKGQFDMADAEILSGGVSSLQADAEFKESLTLNKPYLGDRRVQLLEQGIAATKGDRNKTHGDFYEQHVTASRYINIYLQERFGADFTIQASDVAAILALVKQSRMLHGEYNADDHLDAAVYITGRAECIEKELGGQ